MRKTWASVWIWAIATGYKVSTLIIVTRDYLIHVFLYQLLSVMLCTLILGPLKSKRLPSMNLLAIKKLIQPVFIQTEQLSRRLAMMELSDCLIFVNYDILDVRPLLNNQALCAVRLLVCP